MPLQDKTDIKRFSILAVFCAVSIIMGYVESIIPFNFGIPGVKLGLANLVTVVLISFNNGYFKFKEIILVCLTRILVVGFLFGNMYGIIYSLCGGILSLISMYFMNKTNKFGVLGISVLGGVMHNFAQLFVAMVVVDQLKLVFYAPVLLLSGSLFGALLGIIAAIVLPKLEGIEGRNL